MSSGDLNKVKEKSERKEAVIGVRVSESMHLKLSKMAKSKGMTIGSLVRHWIDLKLKEK